MAYGVFLVDDHEVARVGLRSMIAATDDIEVLGEAATARDALEQIRAMPRQPDVALIDLQLGQESGVDLCEWLQAEVPEVRCLMLSAFRYRAAVASAIKAGAVGYVLKEGHQSELLDAVRTVAAGGTAFDPSLEKTQRPGSPSTSASDRLNSLSDQELRILLLIAEGHTNRQIGETLYLAEGTVKNYVSHLLAKLDMVRRSEAAGFAARLVEAGELRPPI